MPETILVTSATGKIGTELCHLLATSSAGHRVRAATRDPEGPRARLLRAYRPDSVEPVQLDMRSAESLARATADERFIQPSIFSGQVGPPHPVPAAAGVAVAGRWCHARTLGER